MNDYYRTIQYLPLVDEKGKIIGRGEKNKLHKKGILHKGFSIGLFLNKKIILQKRKHLFFDKVTDFTASGHSIAIGPSFQKEKEAVYETLLREWSLKRKEIKNLTKKGSFFYKAKDKEDFIEHEFCTVYHARVDFTPSPNFDFAYGYDLVDWDFLVNNQELFPLSPWLSASLKIKSLRIA
ncbi:MAG: hypothetical protein UU21_C0022G0006 [Candidatus Levybacteria bacterium GW2011_GWA2_40_8]|nr:MAG: hypothetical protein UU21_C0022G0006 [Candidatus Levybacteria bacterium GW2011_GWA2_40_8]